jgi:hypothetical protein
MVVKSLLYKATTPELPVDKAEATQFIKAALVTYFQGFLHLQVILLLSPKAVLFFPC